MWWREIRVNTMDFEDLESSANNKSELNLHEYVCTHLLDYARGPQGQRLALNSNLCSFAKESPKCDLLLVMDSSTDDDNRVRSKAIVVWLVELFKKFAPQLIVEVKFHRLSNTYALYLSAPYLSLLKGAELCHLKKPVKSCFGGGMRDFSVDCAHVFCDIENKDVFFSEMERSLIVKQIIEIIRSPCGGLRFTNASPLLSRFNKSTTTISRQDYVDADENDTTMLEIPEGRTVFSTLYSLGTVKSVFPLHNAERLKRLEHQWVYSFSPSQPIEEIKEYFGTEIAFYFAWLSHLSTALWIPAIIGILMFAFNGDNIGLNDKASSGNSLYSDVCFVLFAIFNCVWSSTYLELWKRKQAELSFQWGTYEVRPDDSLISDIRPEFKGDRVVRNPVSGRTEPHYSPWKHALIRFGLTYPVTFACIVLVFIFLFLMLQIQQVVDIYFKTSHAFKWVTYLPMIVQSIIILIADHLYRHLALFFNDLENYRTDEEYENFLISKIATFQCVNAFGSLFYVAFYLNDSTRLQETLATLLISRQVIQNVAEISAPFLKEKFRLFRMTNKLTRSLSDNSLKRRVEDIRRKSEMTVGSHEFSSKFFNDITNTRYQLRDDSSELRMRSPIDKNLRPDFNRDSSLKRSATTLSGSERLPIPEFLPNDEDALEVNGAELQSMMTKYLRPLDDYLEMFIQFGWLIIFYNLFLINVICLGYVVLFSPAFPLAATCLLANIFIEVRVDAFKLCNTLQRPFGRRVRNIGAWQSAMQLMGALGVFVNCALISKSGLLQRLWPDLSLTGQILLIVVMEHLIFAVRFLIDLVIPDVPYWIRVETAKVENWRCEAYKNDLKFSTCPTSPFAELCHLPTGALSRSHSRNHSSGSKIDMYERSRPDSPLVNNSNNNYYYT